MSNKNNKLSLINDGIEISAKTALSLLPIGGALITGVWDAVKSNCVQKRLEEWQSLVEDKLCVLEYTLEDIGNNENFTTALFHATEMAIKTAEQEKRKYLANAVVNSISCNLEESIMMMFINMIDKYTIMHINILAYFQDPRKFINDPHIAMGSPKGFLYKAYPQFEEHDELVDKVVKELYYEGLLSTSELNIIMSSQGMMSSRITKLGNDFINFISNDQKDGD